MSVSSGARLSGKTNLVTDSEVTEKADYLVRMINAPCLSGEGNAISTANDIMKG